MHRHSAPHRVRRQCRIGGVDNADIVNLEHARELPVGIPRFCGITKSQVDGLPGIVVKGHTHDIPTDSNIRMYRVDSRKGVITAQITVVDCRGNHNAIGVRVIKLWGGIPTQQQLIVSANGQNGQRNGTRDEPAVGRLPYIDSHRHGVVGIVGHHPLAALRLPPAGEVVTKVFHPRQSIHRVARSDVHYNLGTVGTVGIGGPHGNGIQTTHLGQQRSLRATVEGQRCVSMLCHSGCPGVGEARSVTLQQGSCERHRCAGE